MLEKVISEILEPSTMHPLRVERDIVDAGDVFHDERVWKSLREYSNTLRCYEEGGRLPSSVAEINKMTVPDGYIPDDVSHQDVTGTNLIKQVRLIEGASFLKAVSSHPDYKEVPGFERQRQLMNSAGCTKGLFRSVGRLFKREQIHTVLGSAAEKKIAQQCFGTIWPPGVNLYSILREMYLVFHARLTGQIPVYLADNLKDLLDTKVYSKNISGIGRFVVDKNSRSLGLHPVAEVPADHVTLNSQFVSQDQLGRRAIARRILDDVFDALQGNRDRRVVVIDYAGGVGNISELLLKQIYVLPEGDMKLRLMKQLRIAVIDMADDQLAAGRNRYDQMSKNPKLEGINDKIIFIKGDVTKSLSEEPLMKLKDKFGPEFLNRPVYLGMTSYTTGALDNRSKKDDTTFTDAIADAMFKQCWKVYAVDFSSPMWRLEDFLRDTGNWGKEYLRTVHGVVDREDEHTSLNKMVSTVLKLRYGLIFDTVADFVRFMATGPGLASHYVTVWPGSGGHSAGYTVLEDGSLKKPSILSFAERLQEYGAKVGYKSKVWLFATDDLGKTSKGNRAWAFIPGWVADFVVAENEKNSPHK
jgi:hypothetical protein